MSTKDGEGVLGQTKQFLPFVGTGTVDANTYLVLTGAMGIVGWGIDAALFQMTTANEAGIRPAAGNLGEAG